jgi:hypothetical protein
MNPGEPSLSQVTSATLRQHVGIQCLVSRLQLVAVCGSEVRLTLG